MAKFVKTAGVYFGAGFLLLIVAGAWFCSGLGLPETRLLQGLAPGNAASVAPTLSYGSCPATQHVATVQDVRSLFSVLNTAYGDDEYGHLSTQTARTLDVCGGDRSNLALPFRELRLTAYVRTHYKRDERKTLFLNRMYFGNLHIGITDAAQFYFHRSVSQLDTAQAALLLGLIRDPNRNSPLKHPDRALVRRNEVIDLMVANGTLAASQAELEKQKGLLD